MPFAKFTASSFFAFTIFAYICVVSISACPNNLLVVYRSAPNVSIIVAKVWRATWNVTFFVIPAAFAHLSILLFQHCPVGKLKILLSIEAVPLFGINFCACSDIGKYSGSFVFCICNCKRICSPSCVICFHVIADISLMRKPQKHENKKAFLIISRLQSVAISFLISSIVKYSRVLSGTFILSTLAILSKGLLNMISARTAAFSAPVKHL